MGLHELTLRHFRCFNELQLRPDPEAVTVLLSPNGTGKTSVLEAVHALATASSFRTTSASDMVATGDTIAEVHGLLFHHERRVQVDLTLTRGPRSTAKHMLVNGQRPTSRSALAEVLPLTVFTPEGVDVIRHGPEQRRNLLNQLLSDLAPQSSEILERFQRSLTQRNAFFRALRGEVPTTSQRDELGVWDQEFIASSYQLVERREDFITRVAPLVEGVYQELAQTTAGVSLGYETSWGEDLEQAMHRALRDDVARGYSTVGPQRDDVVTQLHGRDARRQASQGEQRSLALAFRLGAHQLIKSLRNVDPLLLLDDVFSELDPQRSEQLLRLLPRGQTLVTTSVPLPAPMRPASIIDVTEL